jgi:hypothetical protein
MSGRLRLAETATAAGVLLLLGERIMTAVVSIGEMYESGLYVEDFTAFLANAPALHGATDMPPTRRLRKPANRGRTALALTAPRSRTAWQAGVRRR